MLKSLQMAAEKDVDVVVIKDVVVEDVTMIVVAEDAVAEETLVVEIVAVAVLKNAVNLGVILEVVNLKERAEGEAINQLQVLEEDVEEVNLVIS